MEQKFRVPNITIRNKYSVGTGKSRSFPLEKMGVMYEIEAFEKGKLLWTRKAHNVITSVGAEQILVNLMTASGETTVPSWYIGLMYANPNQTNNTASMTAASATLTLGTALGTELVVGQTVTIVGAGASGGNLVTTVAAVVSTTSYTLAANAVTAVSAVTIVAAPVLVVGDTSASHPGWTETTSTMITQTTRPIFNVGPVALSGVNAIKTNNTNPASFNGGTTTWWMTGLLMASSDVIGSTTDIILSEAPFDANATPPGAAQISSGMSLSVKATFQANAA